MRQGRNVNIHAINNGEYAPPPCAPMKNIPCARPRSDFGNQRENVFAEFGHAPASPIPNKKRTASKLTKFQAPAVSIVNIDHHDTIRISTLRVPTLSPHHPVGISKSP